MSLQHNTKKIGKNTLVLYLRTLVTLVIGLYSSRLVLLSLGVENFGIYNIVGGVVMMFTLLCGSMTTATQRFISFEMGKKDGDTSHVFSATLTIHILISLIIFVIAETVGLWFLNSKLVIAPNRIVAANWVYQFSVLTLIVNLLSIPYNGLIVAHERMDAFAIISIVEAFLKLAVVVSLRFFLMDRLIIYSALMFAVALIIRATYNIFCNRKFSESKYRFFKKSPVYKSIIQFTGWNFFGNSSAIFTNQGINILINLFFGVIPNAARGIANQVDNALQSFVNNFTMALNPQITKAYASGDKDYVMTLVIQGGKFCFFLFFIFAAPIIATTPEILKLWLKVVPDHAVIFVRLSLVFLMIMTWSQTLYILMLASGDIKKYQIWVGTVNFMSFPITWILFKLGFPVESCYYAVIVVNIVCFVIKLIILQETTNLSSLLYVKKAIIPPIIVSVIIFAFTEILVYYQLHWILVFFCCFVSSIITILYIGLNKQDRTKVKNIVFQFKANTLSKLKKSTNIKS